MSLDKERFAFGLQKLGNVFNRRVNDDLVDAYYYALADAFTDDTWETTVGHTIQGAETGDRMPLPNDLRKMLPSRGVTPHSCRLCADRPGWVIASIRGSSPHLAPCPNRRDTRALKWYQDEADRRKMALGEVREQAEATARELSIREARRLMGRIDPDGRLGQKMPETRQDDRSGLLGDNPVGEGDHDQ